MGYLEMTADEDDASMSVVKPLDHGFTSGFRAYPVYRDVQQMYMVIGRSQLDGADGLWRVHNRLYDLSTFADKHPGGAYFINTTRGLDITELFESCHLSSTAERLLPKYYVRDATVPRNSPYTFHDNGFFRTLKRRVAGQLLADGGGTGPLRQTHVLMDGLVVASLATGWLAAAYDSLALALLAGFVLHMVPNLAHNYVHQRNSWRMYYVGLTQALTVNGFRGMHVLTHHIFPNTIYDADIFTIEPMIRALTQPKTSLQRWLSPLLLTVVLATGGVLQVAANMVYYISSGTLLATPESLLTLAWLPLYFAAAGGSWMTAARTWFIVTQTSFFFAILLLFAGTHRHPDNYHDGDPSRVDRDWGLLQLDTCNERREFQTTVTLSSLFFGDHALHHLFPTVDCGRLASLYPLLFDVCRQFDIELRVYSQWEVTKLMFSQMVRCRPHARGPERHGYTGPTL